MSDRGRMYKVHCEILTALPDTEDVFFKVWAHSTHEARRRVFSWIRDDYEYFVVTDKVEILPNEGYKKLDKDNQE